MVQKIKDFPLMAYIVITGAVKGFVQDMKNDERGLSGIVEAVLLILVAVLAVVLIWGALSGWLGELWEKIIGKANQVQ